MNATTPRFSPARAACAVLAVAVLASALAPGLAGSLGTTAMSADAAKRRGSARKVQQFTNATPIAIADNATSLPSTIEVQGFETEIIDINVSLNVYSHNQPSDVDVLLVGPSGQTALIMSDVASASNAASDSLVLDDQAAIPLPKQDDLTSGKFQPTNYDFTNDQDAFAPDVRIPSPLPKVTSLANFNDTSPNGTWTLFVDDDDDDTQDTSGSIAGGWSLSIITANGAPRAQSDTFQVRAGQTLTVDPASGVLRNDRDPDDNPLTAILESQPTKSQVVLQPDGSFTYRANKKAKGTDAFTYLAQDPDGLNALAEVTIQIKGKKKHKKHKRK